MKSPKDTSRLGLVSAILIVVGGVLVGLLIGWLIHRNNQPATQASTNTANTSAEASQVAPQITACGHTGLALTATQGSGAAGTTYFWIGLKNQDTATCTLHGYPGASLIASNGQMLGGFATHNGVYKSKTISLAPGKTAYALVGFPNPGNFPPGTCSEPASKLRIYVPDDTTPLSAVTNEQYCRGFSISAFVTHKQ